MTQPITTDQDRQADAAAEHTSAEVVLGRPVDTPGVALQALVFLAGLKTVVADLEAEVRRQLEQQVAARATADDADPKVSRRGVGTAWITTPTKQYVPADRQAFAAWALQHHPDDARRRLTVDAARLAAWLNDPTGNADPDARAAQLRTLVGDPRVVAEDVTVPESLLAELGATCPEGDNGMLYDPGTGGELPVRSRYASAPAFTCRLDKRAVAAVATVARARLAELRTLPALQAPADGGGAAP